MLKLLAIVPVAVCAVAAADPGLSVRLQTPLSSFSTPAGTPVSAIALTPLEINGNVVIPPGAIVKGTVVKATSVGVGVLRERAGLDLNFGEYVLPDDGRTIEFQAQVRRVDNAREDVTSDGRIRGVLAAGGTPALVRGIWRIPSAGMFQKSAAGLTGVGGRIWTAYGLGPFGAVSLLAVRWTMLRFPEPEIQLPVGTEMELAVSSVAPDAPRFESLPIELERSELALHLGSLHYEVRKPNGKPAEDILNMTFASTQAELEQAFKAAGWVPTDALTRATFSRMYRAYTSMSGYPQSPVSKLYWDGREPDLVFQKSLNTVAQRHHIRLWQLAGQDLWVGAATHDIGVGFDMRIRVMTHRIDSDIDKEREKITADLSMAGCIERVTMVQRDGLSQSLRSITTDGHMALVNLHACESPSPAVQPTRNRPMNVLVRVARRITLETKHYALRDNAYHYGYVAIRSAVRANNRRIVAKREAAQPEVRSSRSQNGI